jgi:hypothetical protein
MLHIRVLSPPDVTARLLDRLADLSTQRSLWRRLEARQRTL